MAVLASFCQVGIRITVTQCKAVAISRTCLDCCEENTKHGKTTRYTSWWKLLNVLGRVYRNHVS